LITSDSSSAPARKVRITAPKLAKKFTQGVTSGWIVFPATMPTMSSIRAAEMANLKEMKLEILL